MNNAEKLKILYEYIVDLPFERLNLYKFRILRQCNVNNLSKYNYKYLTAEMYQRLLSNNFYISKSKFSDAKIVSELLDFTLNEVLSNSKLVPYFLENCAYIKSQQQLHKNYIKNVIKG